MGRTIIVDQSVESYIEKLAKGNKWYIGVIIGQLTSQRDYVVHLARTPDPQENEVSEENVEEENGDGFSVTVATTEINSKEKSNNPVERPASLEDIEEKWVSLHAKQVTRMLPGGLSVIGLFAVAPPAMLKAAQPKLRQIMFSVYKQLQKASLAPNTPHTDQISDRILLQVDITTKRLTCTTLDTGDVKSAPRPAEWKTQTGSGGGGGGGSSWVRLNSNISLDTTIIVDKDSKPATLLKQIQGGLSDLQSSLGHSVVTVGGAIRPTSEPLVQKAEKKGGKGGKGQHSPPLVEAYDVSIFLPLPYSTESSTDPDTEPTPRPCQATINLVGTSTIRAFVSAKATVGDAIEAVKTDVMRSVMARCELLCEEFEVAEVASEGSEVYDPPVRLFCGLPHTNVQVCDYTFQDEKTDEVSSRITELLDIDVDNLEVAEQSAADDVSSWDQPTLCNVVDSHTELSAEEQSVRRSSVARTHSYVGAIIGASVAVLAAGASLLYSFAE